MIGEAALVVGAPRIELRKGWKLRVLTQELEERSVTSGKEAKEVVGEFFSEGLAGAFRPQRAIIRVWKSSKFLQRRTHPRKNGRVG